MKENRMQVKKFDIRIAAAVFVSLVILGAISTKIYDLWSVYQQQEQQRIEERERRIVAVTKALKDRNLTNAEKIAVCRENGGAPIVTIFLGRLKDCRIE